MKSGKLVLGLLAGVATGALLGILFAPDKGSKTRKKILDKGDDYVDAVKEKFTEAINKVSKEYKGYKDKADEIISNGKNKYQEFRKEGKNETV